MAPLSCELWSRAAKPREAATSRPVWSRISASAPTRAARSSTGTRSADAQLSWRSHAAPAAAANAAVSPASSAIAASATAANIRASRSPIASPREPGSREPGSRVPGSRVPGPGRSESSSAIARQAEPVAAAQHGLDDLRVAGLILDLAAQVLNVRVDSALIPLELISAHPVDQLEA